MTHAQLLELAANLFEIFTEALVVTVATFLMFKGLLLERQSDLGRALGRNNLAMALFYYLAALALWFPIIKHPVVRGTLYVIIFLTSVTAIRAFVRVYGGWRATLREAGEVVRELAVEVCRWPARMRRKVSSIVSIIIGNWRVYRKICLVLALLVVLVVLVMFVVLVKI